MERMTKIGMVGVALIMLAACGKGIPSYDATGTFEATEVIVSAEAAGKLLRLEVEEGTRLKAGEEIGLVDTVQLSVEVTKRVYFIGNERMLIAHDSNRLRFS